MPNSLKAPKGKPLVVQEFEKKARRRKISLDEFFVTTFFGISRHSLPSLQKLERETSYSHTISALAFAPLGKRLEVGLEASRDFSSKSHFLIRENPIATFKGEPRLNPSLSTKGVFFGLRTNRQGKRALISWRIGLQQVQLQNFDLQSRLGLVLSPRWMLLSDSAQRHLVLLNLFAGHFQGAKWESGRALKPNYNFGIRFIHMASIWRSLKITWMIGLDQLKQTHGSRIFRYGRLQFGIGLGY